MHHTIEFRVAGWAELEAPRRGGLTLVELERGLRLRAIVATYVVESEEGPIEVSDLLSEDGGAIRGVRCAYFRFVD